MKYRMVVPGEGRGTELTAEEKRALRLGEEA
jgi:hypothetical protein